MFNKKLDYIPLWGWRRGAPQEPKPPVTLRNLVHLTLICQRGSEMVQYSWHCEYDAKTDPQALEPFKEFHDWFLKKPRSTHFIFKCREGQRILFRNQIVGINLHKTLE
jgi:hypothetical protein